MPVPIEPPTPEGAEEQAPGPPPTPTTVTPPVNAEAPPMTAEPAAADDVDDHRSTDVLPVAIALGLQRVETPRPMTHDLLVDVLASTSTAVKQVTITEVRDGTFIAEVALSGPHGPRTVDCRPSDAIALAVRLEVPVFVAESVVDAAGVALMLEPPDDEGDADAEGDPEELVAEFRSFLDSVDPGDFS